MCVWVKGFELHIGSHEVFTGGVYLSFIHGSRGLLSLEPVLEQKVSNKLVITRISTWSQGKCVMVPIEWKWFVLTLILTKIMSKQMVGKFYIKISFKTKMNYIFRSLTSLKKNPQQWKVLITGGNFIFSFTFTFFRYTIKKIKF